VTNYDEPWLADVGFGGSVATEQLRMDHTQPQPTPHDPYLVIQYGAWLIVQALNDGRWHALYELSQEPQLAVDFEPPNWFTATHPTSHFRQRLIVSRATPEARHRLLNARLTVRTPDGRVERRTLDADQIEEVVRETFGLPVEPAWRPIFERAAGPERGA
jgi:N-hydroxyarylamine O-acetyltransferase